MTNLIIPIILILIPIINKNAIKTENDLQKVCGFKTEDHIPIIWKQFPIEIIVDDNIGDDMFNVIVEAGRAWEDAANKKFFSFKRKSTLDRLFSILEDGIGDGITTIYLDNEHIYTNVTVHASTFTRHIGKTMFEADIFINVKDFEWEVKDTEINNKKVHLKSTMIHELGHLLGLKHSDNEESIMYGYSSNGQIRTLTQEDINNINCGYK